MPHVYTFTSNKAADTSRAGKQHIVPPRRSKRHRKLSGHEKRRYLSNVTECNIFRVQAQYSIKPISNERASCGQITFAIVRVTRNVASLKSHTCTCGKLKLEKICNTHISFTCKRERERENSF